MSGLDTGPLLSVRGLQKHFPARRGLFGAKTGSVRAVDGADLDIARREVVGLVGESGSGKTTVGRTVVRLIDPTAGSIHYSGTDIAGLSAEAFKPYRQKMQIVFQDPFASLDPRMRIETIIAEGLVIHGIGTRKDRRDRVAELLEMVGLPADTMQRYPHEFSGGQRQRLGIARALAVKPEFIVADEPVSALDVSIQAQVINLLSDLQQKMGLTLLFISHDLSVVEYICDRVIVMYLGHVVESGPTAEIFARPMHPYTEALLSAIPNPDPDANKRKIVLTGDIPSPANPPSGCVFRTRCPLAVAQCAEQVPPPVAVGPGHSSACIRTELMGSRY